MTIAQGQTATASDVLAIQATANAALVGGAAAHGVLIGTGATAVATAIGTVGQALISNGPSVDPTFGTLSSSLISDFGSAVVAAAPVRVAGAGLVIASGTISPVLGGGLVLANGSITANGTVGSVNLTSATGLQINSVSVINIDSTGICTYVGVGAGNGASGFANCAFGNLSGGQLTTATENAFFGQSAGDQVTTGSFHTAVGQHALGSETTATASTAVGNDSQRNVISSGGANTSVGQHSQYIHGGSSVTSVGQSSYVGNGCCIMLGGTATAGDTISLTVTGSFVGSPQTVGITVTAAQSLGSMATALYAAFRTNSTLVNLIGQSSISGVFDTSNINLNWYHIAIQNVTVTAAVTGAATETVTVLAGATANSNIAIGQRAMQAFYLTTATNCIGIGAQTLYRLQSGNNNIAVGANAGQSITIGHDNLILGNTTGDAITTGNFNTAVGNNAAGGATTAGGLAILGYNSGASITTGGSNSVIGANVASTTLSTGSGNILIGVDANTDTAAASTSNTLQIRGSGASAVPVIAASAINTATPIVAINGKVSVQAFTSATTPVAGTDIPAGFGMLWKNTGDSSVKLYYNDGGTLKSVALA